MVFIKCGRKPLYFIPCGRKPLDFIPCGRKPLDTIFPPLSEPFTVKVRQFVKRVTGSKAGSEDSSVVENTSAKC